MKIPHAFIVFCVALAMALPHTSFAAGADVEPLPPGVFRMADGSLYHPGTGSHAGTIEDIKRLAGIIDDTTSLPSVPLTATSSEPSVDGSPGLPYIMPTPLDPFPLKSAIRRGRELLQAKIDADAVGMKLRIATKEAEVRHVTVAVWNPKTDMIRTVDGMKEGVKFVPDSRSDVGIRVIRSNGINSEFDVKDADGELVVAIRYPIYKDISVSKKQKKFEIDDAAYVPYSADLHTPEMVAYGKAWMDNKIVEVLGGLRAEGVPSRSAPAKRLADVISPELVEVVMAIEHIDQTAIAKDAQRQLERFYVILAANEDASFGYSKSPVGALGLVQFMPKTYAFMASQPKLGLIREFETAMRTPSNAIRAQVAYLDYLLANLPKGTVSLLDAQSDLVHEYIAASYNGGYARVKKAMAAWEENLDAKQRLHVLSRSRLRIETMKYILKLRQVRGMLRKGAIQVASSA